MITLLSPRLCSFGFGLAHFHDKSSSSIELVLDQCFPSRDCTDCWPAQLRCPAQFLFRSFRKVNYSHVCPSPVPIAPFPSSRWVPRNEPGPTRGFFPFKGSFCSLLFGDQVMNSGEAPYTSLIVTDRNSNDLKKKVTFLEPFFFFFF